VGIIRDSARMEPLEKHREIISKYADAEGIEIVGWAIDLAVSAFRSPPHKRRQVYSWLERAEDFDCFIYYRQDRCFRRMVDYMRTVLWCVDNGKGLYSATEKTGDVTQHENMMRGFMLAYDAESESRAKAERTGIAQARLAIKGHWRGGRPGFGLIGMPKGDGDGYTLAPHPMQGPIALEATRRIIGGESPHHVMADFNRCGVLSADGRLWKGTGLTKILRNRGLVVYGVIPPEEWEALQRVLDARKHSRSPRVADRDNFILDLMFHGDCGGKIYRWHRNGDRRPFGRCVNELKRSESSQPCRMPMVPYVILEESIVDDVIAHADCAIEIRANAERIKTRLDTIGRELIRLSEQLAARSVGRDDYLREQGELLAEQDRLEGSQGAALWVPTGETVGERWARLSSAEKRMWLLKVGVRWRVYVDDGPDGRQWRVVGSWCPDDPAYRERVAGVHELSSAAA
jgi:DNA invertase Pin-like site-specific DNA recombinase